jgi:pilus assembly protein CpaE
MTVGPLTVLVALEREVDGAAVEASLSGEGIQVVGFVHGFDDQDNPQQDTPSDVLVLACVEPSDSALAFVRTATRRQPDRPVVVLAAAGDNGYVGRVFEAGADDLVKLPEGDDPQGAQDLADHLAFVLQKAVARKSGAPVSGLAPAGRLICVLGPKGGIGKTLTTSNLAVSLASDGAKVAVVDVDLQFGDVGLALGLRPEQTVFDLARSGGALDEEKLDAFLASHESGARVLLAPTRPDQAGAVSAEFLSTVYPTLRSMSDYVVVDTPPGFTPEVIASIDSSSDICLVGMLDSLSLKNTKLGLETLELMGYDLDRVRLVLNRADSRVGITPADVTEIVGRAPDVLVPSSRDVTRSVNEGVPIVAAQPRSEAAKAFNSLAELFREPGHSLNGSSPNGGSGRRFRIGKR